MTERRWRALWLCMMLLMMVTIFLLSSQSGEESYRVSVAVSKAVGATPSESNRQVNIGGQQAGQNYNLFGKLNTRKLAHMCLYAFLGISTFFALKPRWWRPLLALAIDYAYAFGDEVHQYYVGRTGLLSDTFYDAAGFGLAIACCSIFALLYRKTRRKRNKPWKRKEISAWTL